MFEPVKLHWKGRDVTILPKRVLGAITAAEEFLTFEDIANLRTRPQLAKVSAAYAAVLRYAGIDADDAEVYSAICDPVQSEQVFAQDIAAIITMMLPKHVMREASPRPVRRKRKTS